MSDGWVNSLLKLYDEIRFPVETKITVSAKYGFYRAMDICLMYRGHPDTLMEALGVFLETDCRPFAYAGAAKIMMQGSYISSDTYGESGIQASRELLEVARQGIESCFEIELIQADIELAANDLEGVRSALKTLIEFDEAEDSYYVALMVMISMAKLNKIEERQRWGDLAEKRAITDAQKIFVINRRAKDYMNDFRWLAAIRYFEEVLKLNKRDPWAWHNLSICHIEVDDWESAESCNETALGLMNFGAAHQVRNRILQEKQIDKKRRWGKRKFKG